MDHPNAPNRISPRQLAADLRHHLHRHRFVAFVVQVQGGPAAAVVARHAFETYHCPILTPQQARPQLTGVDRLAGEREEVALRLLDDLMRVAAGPAADRRQQRDLVSFLHHRLPRAELLVASGQDALGHLTQARKPCGVVIENRLQARPSLQFQELLRLAHNLPQYPKKQDLDPHLKPSYQTVSGNASVSGAVG